MTATRADEAVRTDRRQTALAIGIAAAIMFVLVTTSVILVDRFSGGPDARAATLATERLLAADAAARVRAECVTAYRGEWQNAVGDIVLVASRGNDPTDAQVRALARSQRHSLRINELCNPAQRGGVQLPGPSR